MYLNKKQQVDRKAEVNFLRPCLKSVGVGNLITIINYLTEMPRNEGAKHFLQMYTDSLRDKGDKVQQMKFKLGTGRHFSQLVVKH